MNLQPNQTSEKTNAQELDFQDTSSKYAPKVFALMNSLSMPEGNLAGLRIQKTPNLHSHSPPLEPRVQAQFFPKDPESRTEENCYLLGFHSDFDWKNTFGAAASDSQTEQQIERVLKSAGADSISLFGTSGGSLCFPEGTLPLELLRSLPFVAYIERDCTIKGNLVQKNPPWNLDRIDQPSLPLNDAFDFQRTGKGVHVYVIDSGIDAKHPGKHFQKNINHLISHLEFGNRAELSKSFLKDSKDCAGHGTQVASIIAGTNVGVAKAAQIHALKILDCNGTGKNAHLIGAVYWIIKHHQKPAVINMSVGGIQSKAIDRAVQDAYNAGILVVTAAGNTNADACYVSPSGSPLSLNVGSVNKQDQKADFSNWGSCVDIMAPGVEIVCASPRKGKRRARYGYSSGTSASAPMVTGIATHFLEWNPDLSPDMLRTLIYENAAINRLHGASLKGCVNRIAQVPKNIGASEKNKNIKFSKIKVSQGSSFFYSETSGDGCCSNSTWYWILIGLSIGFFVLAIVSSFIFWWRSRHPEQRSIARTERTR